MPRLFLALDLPPPHRSVLTALCDGIPGTRWVAPEQFHITLRFFGQVPDEQVATLCAHLTAVSAPAFAASLQGVGVFPSSPSRRRPARVLWAGVEPAAPMAAVKAAVDAAVEATLGPDPEAAEHAFSPHITLARFKLPPRRETLSRFLEQHRALASEPFAVDSFTLYQSRTQASGALYTPLQRHRFAP
jgi:RNA 2',3'-cyclic 3'-phosphodiesterase